MSPGPDGPFRASGPSVGTRCGRRAAAPWCMPYRAGQSLPARPGSPPEGGPPCDPEEGPAGSRSNRWVPGVQRRWLSMDPKVLERKFCGCLLGLAVGDALGAPFEGRRSVSGSEVYAAARRRRILRYPDDTHMALGVAESLAACGGFDGRHMAETFVRNFEREPWRGYGPGPPRIFRRIKLGAPWDRAAEDIYPGGSFGNGAAMRAAPGIRSLVGSHGPGERGPGPFLEHLFREGPPLRHHGCWFGFSGPFCFGFSFGLPFGWWGTMSVEEELGLLREYQRRLEEELERVKERIRRLEGRQE